MGNFLEEITSSKENARNYLIKLGVCTEEDFNKADEVKTEKIKEEEFPYVVAQLWRPNDAITWKNLRIYTYGGDVLFGTKEDADGFLKYVKRQKRYDGSSYDNDPENNPWKIYKINFEEYNG